MRFKIERRLDIPKWAGVVVPLVSVGIALLIMGIVIFFYMHSKPSYLKQAVHGALNEYASSLEKIPEKSWPRVEKMIEIGRVKSAPAIPKGKLSSNVSSFAVSRLEEVFRATEEAYKFVKEIGESSKEFPKDFSELKKTYERLGDILRAYGYLKRALDTARSIEGYDPNALSEYLNSFEEKLKGVEGFGSIVEDLERMDLSKKEIVVSKLESAVRQFPGVLAMKLLLPMKKTLDWMNDRCPSSVWKQIFDEYTVKLGNAITMMEPLAFSEVSSKVDEISTYYCLSPLLKVWRDSEKPLEELHKKVGVLEGVNSQLKSAKRSLEGALRSLKKGRTFFVKDSISSASRYVSIAYRKLKGDGFLSGVFAQELKSLRDLSSEFEEFSKSLEKTNLKEKVQEITSRVEELKGKIEKISTGMVESFRRSAEAFVDGIVDSVEKVQVELFKEGGIESTLSSSVRRILVSYKFKLEEATKGGIDRLKMNSAKSALRDASKSFARFLRDISSVYPPRDDKMKLALDYEFYVFGMEALRKEISSRIIHDSELAKDEMDSLFKGKITKEEFMTGLKKILDEHLERVRSILDDFTQDFDELTKKFGRVNEIGWIAVFKAYDQLFTWPFIPSQGLPDTINYMTPLLFIGLGLILVFQMKLWNIGAEGQYYVGVITALWLSLFVIKNAAGYQIPFILIMGGVAGALWAAIAGALRAFLNIDEIVSTLMLNYVAFHWMEHLVYGPWKAPTNFPETNEIPKALFLPTFGESRVHIGVIIAISFSVIVYLLMKKTWWGFDLRVIGDNPNAARYAGVNIAKNIVLAMAVSGFFAGFAGATQVLGFEHKLYHGYAPGYGYTGIIIAWLARLNPWAAILVSFLFGGFLVGGDQIQLVLKLPKAMVFAIEGVILFSLIASEVLFKYRIRVVRK